MAATSRGYAETGRRKKQTKNEELIKLYSLFARMGLIIIVHILLTNSEVTLFLMSEGIMRGSHSDDGAQVFTRTSPCKQTNMSENKRNNTIEY